MMPNAYCLLNHQLTKKQIAELTMEFGTAQIFYPPKNICELWAQVSPMEEDNQTVHTITSWLSSAKDGDLVIIQGEYGSTFSLVDFALKKKLVPVFAATKRIAKEEQNGEIVSRHYIFEHVRFKKYVYYSNP